MILLQPQLFISRHTSAYVLDIEAHNSLYAYEKTTALDRSPAMQASGEKPAALRVLSQLHKNTTSSSESQAQPSQVTQDIFESQILRKHLILRATSPDPTSKDARSLRRKRRLAGTDRIRTKKSLRRLSAKEKRKLGVYDLELLPGGKKTRAEWMVWKGLWSLWADYVAEVLGLALPGIVAGSGTEPESKSKNTVTWSASSLSPQSIGPKVASLDLHGAWLRVVKSNCSSLVGVCGVCVRETKFSFVLVDPSCTVKRVNKRGTIIAAEIPVPSFTRDKDMDQHERMDVATSERQALDLDAFINGEGDRIVFELSGKALECRPTDRATKKFKGRKYDGF